MYQQTFQGNGFQLNLHWGDPALPVQLFGPMGLLASVPLPQLEGPGVLLQTQWGPIVVRLDRSTTTPVFALTNNDQSLIGSVIGHQQQAYQQAPVGAWQMQPQAIPKKSNALAIVLVVGVVGLFFSVGIIGAVVALKDKVSTTFNKVSMPIEQPQPNAFGDSPSELPLTSSSTDFPPNTFAEIPSDTFADVPTDFVTDTTIPGVETYPYSPNDSLVLSPREDLSRNLVYWGGATNIEPIADCMVEKQPGLLLQTPIDPYSPQFQHSLFNCVPDSAGDVIGQVLVTPGLTNEYRSCAGRGMAYGIGALPIAALEANPSHDTKDFPQDIRERLIASITDLCPSIDPAVAARVINE
jgi:Flp pilus assembly pilin Flp